MNILENRLREISDNNKPSEFKHRINKIFRSGVKTLKVEPYHFKSFNFNGNLRSDKLEEEKFTNYIKSYDNKYYEILTEIFDKLKYDNYTFLQEFELDEYEASEYTQASKRLKRIIMKVNNLKDERLLPKIDKFKPTRYQREKEKRFDGIRLYVSTNVNGIIDLYLIDIYHLGIDAYNYKTNSYDLEKNYNTTKEYNKCISKISDKYFNTTNQD